MVRNEKSVADEIWSFFGSGTCLQELYINPKLLTETMWDELAAAAKWSRANSDVLVDTHWIGGDPGKAEVYGWASWRPGKGILVLRNPSETPQEFSITPQAALELPGGVAGHHDPRGDLSPRAAAPGRGPGRRAADQPDPPAVRGRRDGTTTATEGVEGAIPRKQHEYHEPRRTISRRDELPAGRSAAALGMGHVVGRDDRRAGSSRGCPPSWRAVFDIAEYFGLDPYQQFWFSTTDPTIEAVQHHVEGIVSNMDDYLRVRPELFPDHGQAIESMRPWARRQADGEAVVWITLEGFFWFPRTLMGFTKISLAFYDQPELIHQINQDLTDFNLRILDQVEKACVPTFATIAEDMSYNHGPMISEAHFDEFIAPYYRQIVPRLQEWNAPAIVDTDGDVTQMVPWLLREGIQGVLPLERQAGVDGMAMRRRVPRAPAWSATSTRWSWTRASRPCATSSSA